MPGDCMSSPNARELASTIGPEYMGIDEAAALLESAFAEVRRESVDWVDRLYDVRSEPDKLLIMVTNKHYEMHRPAILGPDARKGNS